jgi:hypothetical protein
MIDLLSKQFVDLGELGMIIAGQLLPHAVRIRLVFTDLDVTCLDSYYPLW